MGSLIRVSFIQDFFLGGGTVDACMCASVHSL